MAFKKDVLGVERWAFSVNYRSPDKIQSRISFGTEGENIAG